MDKEYKATYEFLFDKEENLFYRDHRYFDMKEEVMVPKIFWGRGNGWVLGGLVEMLRELPAKTNIVRSIRNCFRNSVTASLIYRAATGSGVQVCSIRTLIHHPEQAVAVSSYMPLPMD